MEYHSAMKTKEVCINITMKVILTCQIKSSQTDKLIPLDKVQVGKKEV